MSYATLQDLIDRFSEDEIIRLSDRADVPTGEVDAAVVAQALDDASDLIDGYLAGRYRLPMEEAPALLGQICSDIARYKLYRDMPTETVAQRNKDALSHLKMIAEGKVVLQVAGIETPDSGGEVLFDAPDPVFSRDSLKGF